MSMKMGRKRNRARGGGVKKNKKEKEGKENARESFNGGRKV